MSTLDHRAVPLATFADPADPQSPWVLSYFAQRRIAGWIGIFLPLVILLITSTTGSRHVPDSISASYYTLGRNYFVGSLCAVAIFLISGIGYDEDRFLSFFAGAMAFLVAFAPCTPPPGIPPHFHSPQIHGTAAILLFVDFAWICLTRFTRTQDQQSASASPHTVTPRKRTRNTVYRACGIVMFVVMAIYGALNLIGHLRGFEIPYLEFAVEWACLWAFGLAWLVKGQQLLADTEPKPNRAAEKPHHQPTLA